jgi:hypothetical protein
VVLRIDKNVRDEKEADTWKLSFSSIQEGLAALRRSQIAQATSDPIDNGRPIYAGPKAYFNDAEQVVGHGLYEAGIQLAAIGFEKSIRQLGEKVGAHPDAGLWTMMNMVADDIGEPEADQLKQLVRFRNALSFSMLRDPDLTKSEALEIVDRFKSGIALAEDALIRRKR